jgi:hypothetical protein
MERTLLLLALSSLLVYSTAQSQAETYIRPYVLLGQGTLTCALVPIRGATLTAKCDDGINPTRTMTAATDKDGLFSFKYHTDYLDNGVLEMVATSAKCVLQSVEPSVITMDMTCAGVDKGSCSINMAPTLLAADMSLTYTVAPAGCTILQSLLPEKAALPVSDVPCPKTSYQTVDDSVTVFSVQDRIIDSIRTDDIKNPIDEKTCEGACMAMPNKTCAHYSYNCYSCTWYLKGAIALKPALLNPLNYEITSGKMVCPTTNIATCN